MLRRRRASSRKLKAAVVERAKFDEAAASGGAELATRSRRLRLQRGGDAGDPVGGAGDLSDSASVSPASRTTPAKSAAIALVPAWRRPRRLLDQRRRCSVAARSDSSFRADYAPRARRRRERGRRSPTSALRASARRPCWRLDAPHLAGRDRALPASRPHSPATTAEVAGSARRPARRRLTCSSARARARIGPLRTRADRVGEAGDRCDARNQRIDRRTAAPQSPRAAPLRPA